MIHSFSAQTFEVQQYDLQKETVVVLVKGFPDQYSGLMLSEEELMKAESFHFSTDRNAFAWRHHLLNSWLSDFTSLNFKEIILQRGKAGKPLLKNDTLHFNISRSGDYLAFAFSSQETGIDIETIKPYHQFDALIDQHFHPNEKEMLRQFPSDKTFISIWTRKEALLKATGSGLTDELKMIDTTEAYLNEGKKRYTLNSFAGEGFILSVACASDNPVKYCQYEVNKKTYG